MPKIIAFTSLAGLMVTSAQARRRGGSGSGEDVFSWLTELVVYVLLGMLVLTVVGALWRYLSHAPQLPTWQERGAMHTTRHQKIEIATANVDTSCDGVFNN